MEERQGDSLFRRRIFGSKINRNRLVPVLWRNPCIGLSETAHYLAPVVLWKADNAR